MSKIEFGQKELEMLINLKKDAENFYHFREGAELRLDELQETIIRQEKAINNMLWASSKVALVAGGGFAGIMAVGYWLMNALHFKAVIAFFKTLRGE